MEGVVAIFSMAVLFAVLFAVLSGLYIAGAILYGIGWLIWRAVAGAR